jgi:hypothetical protein
MIKSKLKLRKLWQKVIKKVDYENWDWCHTNEQYCLWIKLRAMVSPYYTTMNLDSVIDIPF